MTNARMTVRRKVAVAATIAAAGLALPLQVGVAHASTPDDDLSACIANAMSTDSADLAAGMGDTFTNSVDDCVTMYLQELGVDTSASDTAVDTAVDTASDTAVDAGSTGDAVNTGILGTVDGTGVNTGILGTVDTGDASS